MKALKKVLLLTLIIIATASFNNVIAQTFKAEENISSLKVTPRQGLIIDLLKEEIKDNKEFDEYREAINYYLDLASEQDIVAPNCFKYTPLLIEAVNKNARFSMLYNRQGTFGYIFKDKNDVQTTYNFYGAYDPNGKFDLWASITFKKGDMTKELDDDESLDYVMKNFCTPLNNILSQNAGRPIPQLLEILRQKFSR